MTMPIDPRSTDAASVSSPAPDEPSFALSHCAACEREVLTAGDLDDAGELVEVCVHCATPVSATDRHARWAPAGEVVSLGYTVEGVADPSGGKRGCRGGTCGVRQPNAS